MAELASVRRLGWSAYRGHSEGLVWIPLLGRGVRVQDFWVPAVRAMNAALKAAGYEDPCDWTGSYANRKISGSDKWSWHAYGGAIDLDYGGDNPASPDHPGIDRNPHLRTRIYPGFGTDRRFQITEAQVLAVLAIRTRNGKRVWRWLGYPIGDTMHFEPNCSPADIATGIDTETVASGQEEEDMEKFCLAIFAKWSYDDLEAMRHAGYWAGKTAWYRLENGNRGAAPDSGVVNLVIHILANGNADIPGAGGRDGTDGEDGEDGKDGLVEVRINGVIVG